MPTNALDIQNFYIDSLKDTISPTDTIIPVNSVPNVSEGYLVISPDDAIKKEIIYYTSVQSGAGTVTCPSAGLGRGLGGTTALDHYSGEPVKMNITAEYWQALRERITKLEPNVGFHFRSNSGGARSATSNTNWTEMPGFSNNSFTPTVNGICSGSFVIMGMKTGGGDSGVALYVNGVSKLNDFGCMYMTETHWQTQTIPFQFEVTAGVTYTLTLYWRSTTSTTFTICNSSTDQQFPTDIIGVLVAKP